MELRVYLRTLISKWWIVLIVFLITYGATLAFTFTQKPVYQGRATYVVKLNASFSNDKDLASAVDILSRRTEIATTYTIVANSRQIKRLAAEELGLPAEQRADVSVASQLVPGTNVLELTVQAHDPVLARDFTNAAGTKLVLYAKDLYETYTLELLDASGLPDAPIKPNKLLNLMLGGVMGLILGSGFAFLAAYLQAPPENVTNVGILDDETGTYDKRYFASRLRQELSRARRNRYPLSLALINVDRQAALQGGSTLIRREALRRSALLLAPHLRDEDIMAHFDGSVFALLLPDTPGNIARDMIARLQTAIASSTIELERSGVKLDLQASAGIVVYPDIDTNNDIEAEGLIDQVTLALKQAEDATYGKICMVPEREEYLALPEPRAVVGAWKPAKAVNRK
jgi:diguanylate cyclase (GGDEF)-like protein